MTIKFGQLILVVFAVCMNCAIGQDNGLRQTRLTPIRSSPITSPDSSNAPKRTISVDDYLKSLPSLTADGQLSLDTIKSKLIPKQVAVSAIDSDPNPKTFKPLTWMTPNICFGKPYFNDDSLEKHGQSHGFVQPAYSISRLLIQTSLFPVRRTWNLGRSVDCIEFSRFSSTRLD